MWCVVVLLFIIYLCSIVTTSCCGGGATPGRSLINFFTFHLVACAIGAMKVGQIFKVRRALCGVRVSDLAWGFSDLEMTWLLYYACTLAQPLERTHCHYVIIGVKTRLTHRKRQNWNCEFSGRAHRHNAEVPCNYKFTVPIFAVLNLWVHNTCIYTLFFYINLCSSSV